MKKHYMLLTGILLLAAVQTNAQTKIGAAGAPDGSAMLEVTSGTANNRGLLLPRMTLTQRNAISAPATGLMIYNTTSNQVQVNTGTPAAPIWEVATAANSGWDLTGNSGTNPASNFIGTADNQSLAIRTNNTEKVRVTTTGNVGVGTNAPAARLHVVDTGDVTVRVGNSGGTRGHIQLGNDNHGLKRDLTSSGGNINDVALYTSSGSSAGTASSLYLVSQPTFNGSDNLPLDQFVLKNTGDVGIGTNAPARKLHVEGTARIATAIGTPTTITGRNAAGDVGNVTLGSGLSLTGGVLNTTADNADWNLTGNAGTNPTTNFIGTTDSQSLVIRTDNTEQVRVTAAGNVGINNSNPLSPLSFESTTGSKISFFSSGTTNHYGIGVSSNQLNYHVNPGASHTFFTGGRNGDGTELMRIQSNGDVGIGTSTPAQTLHVAGTARISTAVGTPTSITGRNAAGDVGIVTLGSGLSLTGGVLNTTADNADWNLTGNTGTNPATNFIGTGDAQPLVIRTSNTEQVRVTAAGDVGIGTTTPAQSLHVQGTARIATAVGTPTTITGRNASGDVGNVALGTGLSLTAGTLSVTGGTNDWDLTGNAGTNPATNFVGTSDAQPLVIRTSNTEQVRVTAAGDVGIGTTTPAQSLHVQGTARIATAVGTPTTITGRNAAGDVGNVTLGSGLSLTGGVLNTTADNADWNLTGNTGTNPATNFIGTGDAQPLVIRTGNTEKVRVTAAGNVGIGTTSPAFTLDVNGGIKASSDVLTASNGGSAMVWNSVNSGVGETELINYRGTGGGGFRFLTAAPGVVPAAGVGELMRITGAGNVGIGTSNPSTKLVVNGGSLTVSTDATNPNISAPIIHVVNNGGGPNFNDDVDIFSYGASTTPEFAMWTARGTASNPQNAQANDYAGVLRFGTWVNGSKTELNRIQSVYTGDGTTEQSRLTFHATSASSPLMSIESNGNVGIGNGNVAPAYKLAVIGDIAASNTVLANGVVLTSDARLKRNISNTQHGLSTVMALRPVEYEKKHNISDKIYDRHEIGFIAQEIKKVLPGVVIEGKDADKTLAVSYTELIPVLTKAIQEQQAEIEALKAKNEQLEAVNKVTAQLMERVKQMEQMIGIKEIEGTSKVAGK